MNTREPKGLVQEVWAKNALDNAELPAFEDGFDSDYSTSKAPDRRNVNDVLAKATGVAADVNKFGAALPWDEALTYAKDAYVTGQNTGKVYRSLQAGNTDNDPETPSVWWKDYEESIIEQIPLSGRLLDVMVLRNAASGRTTMPSAIQGAVGTRGDFGSTDIWGGTTIGSFNLASAFTQFDAAKTYLVCAQMGFRGVGATYESFYQVKPMDCAAYPIQLGTSNAKTGGSGHGYYFSSMAAEGAFLWQPVATGGLTLNFTQSGSAYGTSCVVRVYEM